MNLSNLSSLMDQSGFKFPIITVAAALALAGLDFVGAIFAKEWATKGHPWLFVAGLLTFGALFMVYARILKIAELSIVTLGWFVFLTVGLIAIDRIRYGVTLSWDKWAAVILILMLQSYLLLSPNKSSSEGDGLPVAGAAASPIRAD